MSNERRNNRGVWRKLLQWLRVRNNGELDLRGADLRGANLQDANMQDANMQDADLTRADLRYANMQGISLWGADLYGADLTRSDLSRANLRSANLYNADLTRSDLRGADLYGADLTRANLRGANLRGVDLREAIGIWRVSATGMSSRGDELFVVDHETHLMVRAGCFWDTAAEFREKVVAEKGADAIYLDFLASIEKHWAQMKAQEANE